MIIERSINCFCFFFFSCFVSINTGLFLPPSTVQGPVKKVSSGTFSDDHRIIFRDLLTSRSK